jgi:hypothetical protein
MTPKSLLRHPQAVSAWTSWRRGGSSGSFRTTPERRRSKRVLLCSGKIFYELRSSARNGADDVAILRLEQLYPLADELLAEMLSPYADETPVYWVQEDPENMGAWPLFRLRFGERLLDRWPVGLVSRPESSSPATGSAASHKLEQARVIALAFGDEDEAVRPDRESGRCEPGRRQHNAEETQTAPWRWKSRSPQAGESITEVQIGEWLKRRGDYVEAGRGGRRDRDRQGVDGAAGAGERRAGRDSLTRRGTSSRSARSSR